MKETAIASLKRGLRIWADRNQISPAQLAADLGYSYNYAWRLLNGDLEVSEAVIGRILMHFGPDAAQEVAQFHSVDLE